MHVKKEMAINMFNYIVMYLMLFSIMGCSSPTKVVDLEKYFDSIVDKNYSIERWDITNEEIEFTEDNIRETYNSMDRYYWFEKKGLEFQIIKKENEGFIKAKKRGYDDIFIFLTFEKDSIKIKLPNKYNYYHLPKLITNKGYKGEGFSINVISSSLIKISVILNEDKDRVNYWIEKENGLVFEYSTSNYSKVIGIPSF